MVDPDDTDSQEAGDVGDEEGPLSEKCLEQVPRTRARVHELQYQKRDGHSEHAVAEGLDARNGHLAMKNPLPASPLGGEVGSAPVAGGAGRGPSVGFNDPTNSV